MYFFSLVISWENADRNPSTPVSAHGSEMDGANSIYSFIEYRN